MSASAALSTGLLLIRLVPPLRDALVELVRAIVVGDEAAERRALEAARRASLIARQRG